MSIQQLLENARAASIAACAADCLRLAYELEGGHVSSARLVVANCACGIHQRARCDGGSVTVRARAEDKLELADARRACAIIYMTGNPDFNMACVFATPTAALARAEDDEREEAQGALRIATRWVDAVEISEAARAELRRQAGPIGRQTKPAHM